MASKGWRKAIRGTTPLEWSLYGAASAVGSTIGFSNMLEDTSPAWKTWSAMASLGLLVCWAISMGMGGWAKNRPGENPFLPFVIDVLGIGLFALLLGLAAKDRASYYSTMASLLGTLLIALVLDHGLAKRSSPPSTPPGGA